MKSLINWVCGLSIGQEGLSWVCVRSELGQGWVQFLEVQVNPILFYQLAGFFVGLTNNMNA